MIRSRNEHYVDEWEGVITVRSIYGGECAGPFHTLSEAEDWIAARRADFDRAARAWNEEQKRKGRYQ